MRKIILLFLFTINLGLVAQERVYQTAFNNADANLLITEFSDPIDLHLVNKKGLYSKQQALLILSDFFKANVGLVYTQKHEGGSKSKSRFEIGELKNKEHQYRTYILYREQANSLQIIELRIELVK